MPAPASSSDTGSVTSTARERIEDRVRGQLMQMALRDLLDQVRGARDALPHLAALEKALGQRGANAVLEVPGHWLAKITSQLSSLPIRQDDRELQELLNRLCAALQVKRDPAPAPIESPRFLSDFQAEGRIEVNEISHSAFAAAVDQSQPLALVPMAAAPAALTASAAAAAPAAVDQPR